MTPNRPNYLRSSTIAMPKLLYCALFITLTTLLACSGPETSSSPTAAAKAPAAASIPAPTTAPVEAPAAPTEAPTPTDTPIPTAMPTPTDTPSEMLNPINMNNPEAFMSQLSSAEQSRGYLLCSSMVDTNQVRGRRDNLARSEIYVRQCSDLLNMAQPWDAKIGTVG